MEIVTHRRRRPRDSPSLDKINKNVPTRTSRGTCGAITGEPGRIFSIVFPLLLPLRLRRRFFVPRGVSPLPSSTPNRDISRIANPEHDDGSYEKLRFCSRYFKMEYLESLFHIKTIFTVSPLLITKM